MINNNLPKCNQNFIQYRVTPLKCCTLQNSYSSNEEGRNGLLPAIKMK
ncbi:MAG: hypothetical protein H7Z13_15340 [Ferruginibacter sp.]|nr:hypothetical protein [Ferruginibacter sp.]